ncbi:unnamed protein product [Adineta ricciae]|uniref:Uncharacterized protein n=1 Tax=Adineta ricciae TaxID=249248 RepID=A0A814TU63_ADIRI|nr:unnamed protein product [Adineta ricciae]
MAARCLFGMFVFGSHSSVVYRFLTDDLYAHLTECFKNRGYKFSTDTNDNTQSMDDNEEQPLSVDDALSVHLAILIRVHEQTSSRQDPLRRITLNSGIQVFFDQIAENSLICMADKSFETVIVLKTINLLKALIKFHIGALPFIHYNAADQLINRISASLQYYLNNVTTNQALLFESCEYLHINPYVREKCNDACTMISNDVQNSLKIQKKIVVITCNDKIVHMYHSPDQSRPSNGDLFLLVLNNLSRPLRKEFDGINLSNVMAHKFQTKFGKPSQSVIDTTTPRDHSISYPPVERTNSSPNLSLSSSTGSNDKYEFAHRSEVVFLRTSNKVIAPFTLFTIPLKENISALILVEWQNSAVCSSIYELIRHLDSYTTHGLFPYDKLSPQVKSVESSGAVRRYFENMNYSSNILSDTLNKAHALHKSASRTNTDINERHRQGLSILRHLTNMSLLSTDVFRHLFFDSDEYARRCSIDIDHDQEADVQMEGIDPVDTRYRRNEHDTSHMAKTVRKKINSLLEDWFSFIEVKSQRNITMSFCDVPFSGLVHFAFINRSRGLIWTPTLTVDDHRYHSFTHSGGNDSEYLLEKKILAFETECLTALQNGFTSYTMSDEHFTFNYALRLQEDNGASARLYKSFVQLQPPGVLYFDFYRALVEEFYRWLPDQSIRCYELIAIHLSVVPLHIVQLQFDKLWRKLMEFDKMSES